MSYTALSDWFSQAHYMTGHSCCMSATALAFKCMILQPKEHLSCCQDDEDIGKQITKSDKVNFLQIGIDACCKAVD